MRFCFYFSKTRSNSTKNRATHDLSVAPRFVGGEWKNFPHSDAIFEKPCCTHIYQTSTLPYTLSLHILCSRRDVFVYFTCEQKGEYFDKNIKIFIKNLKFSEINVYWNKIVWNFPNFSWNFSKLVHKLSGRHSLHVFQRRNFIVSSMRCRLCFSHKLFAYNRKLSIYLRIKRSFVCNFKWFSESFIDFSFKKKSKIQYRTEIRLHMWMLMDTPAHEP